MPQPPALTADDLIAWLEKTSTNWRELIEAHPEILTLPCDIMSVTTVGGLLQHIVAVELRYAEQLSGLPATEYAAIPYNSAAAIYTTHQCAVSLFRQQLASAVDWSERFNFVTRSRGPARSSRKSVLFHALLHSIRHYAQLATLVRQHGIKPDWPMDYLFMDMENT
ncbi:MAG TPA: DinB family protein [Acidobacteriaceae bacterium]|jgi:uncharacterized damage-inducible protein DinB|nr:DinB family protein [Acidobacteriaceae bacterium]